MKASFFALGVVLATSTARAASDEDGAREKGKTTVDSATPAQKNKAQAAYLEGMKQFEQNRYEQALESFKQSYDTVNSPNSRFMVARTEARLGMNVEAYTDLSKVVEEAEAYGDRYADTATAARAKQADIRPRIGLITITADKLPKGSRLTVEKQSVALERLSDPVAVLPGDVRVVAELPDGRVVDRTVNVIAGGDATLSLEPPPPVAADAPSEGSAFIERPGDHLRYKVELEAHAFFLLGDPPGPAGDGGGPGLRAAVELVRGVTGLNDGLGVAAGLDWVATSSDSHFLVPIVAQWNLWVLPQFSVLVEPGAAIMFGAGEYARPVFQAGGRYVVVRDVLAVTARVGIPMVSLGASMMW